MNDTQGFTGTGVQVGATSTSPEAVFGRNLAMASKTLNENLGESLGNVLNEMNIDDNTANTIKNIQEALKNLESTINDLSNQSNGTDLTSVVNDLQSKVNNLEDAKNQLQNTLQNNIIAQDIINQAGNVAFGNDFGGDIINLINKVSDDASNFANNVNVDGSNLAQCKDIIKTLNESYNATQQSINTNFEQQFSNVDNLYKKVNELTSNMSKHIENMIEGIGNSSQSVKQCLSEIEQNFSQEQLNNINDLIGQLATQVSQGGGDFSAKDFISSSDNITNAIGEYTVGAIKNIQDGALIEGAPIVISHIQDVISSQMNAFTSLYDNFDSLFENVNDETKNNLKNYVDSTLSALTEMQTQVTNNIDDLLSQSQNNLIKKYEQQYEDVKNPQTELYKKIMSDFIVADTNQISKIFGQTAENADKGDLSVRSLKDTMTPFSQAKMMFSSTNVLGNLDVLQANFTQTRRTATVIDQNVDKWQEEIKSGYAEGTENGRRRARQAQTNMSLAVTANVDNVLNMAKGMNLKHGGAKNLEGDAKEAFMTSKQMIEDAHKSLTLLIRSIEEANPNDASLPGLKRQQEELTKIKKLADQASESSGTIANVFDSIKNVASGIMGAFGSGLKAIGLGALLSPMQLIGKAMDLQKDEGKRRYKLAMNDAYMGVSLNQGRMMEFARDLPDKYYQMTNGMIGFDEMPNYLTTLSKSVGGHYGGNAEQGASDMADIARSTFAINKMYNMSESTTAGFMKTFYKDLGMSASEAGNALVNVAQAAQNANIPVEKYVQMITNMSNQLRSSGVTGNQVMASMNNLIGRGLREEDAQELVQNQASANMNMANNLNASAFFGMQTGQADNPFEAVAQGMIFTDSNGNVNEDYYNKMAERVYSQNALMTNIGGGAGNSLGLTMMINDLKKQGFSQKSASMIASAAKEGKGTEFIADLIAKEDKKKDGGRESLAEQTAKATDALKKAGDQMSLASKMETEITMMEKHLGEAIETYLAGPLESFKQGFEKLLETVTSGITTFVEGLNKFISSGMAQGAWDKVKDMSPMQAVAGAGALLTGGLLVKRGLGGLKNATLNSINNYNRNYGGIAGNLKHNLYGGKSGAQKMMVNAGLAGSALALGGIAYEIYDSANSENGVIKRLVEMFTTGESKTQTVDKDSQGTSSVEQKLAEASEQNKQAIQSGLNAQNVQNEDFQMPNFNDNNTQYMSLDENGFVEFDEDNDFTEEQEQALINTNLEHLDKYIDESVNSLSKDKSEYFKDFNAQVQKEIDLAKANGEEITEEEAQKRAQATLQSKETQSDFLSSAFVSPLKSLAGLVAFDIAKGKGIKDAWKNLKADNTLSMAEEVGKSGIGKSLATAKKFMKNFGAVSVGMTAIGSTFDEFFGSQKDNGYSTSQKVARVATNVGFEAVGTTLGAIAGSFIPIPVGGTVIGSAIGGWLGAKAGEIVKEKVGLGDVKTIKSKLQEVEDFNKKSEELYGQYVEGTDKSAKELGQITESALIEHKDTLDNCTKDEIDTMNKLFRDLKAKGYSDKIAAYLSGQGLGKIKNDAKFAYANDDKSKANWMLDVAKDLEAQARNAKGDEQDKLYQKAQMASFMGFYYNNSRKKEDWEDLKESDWGSYKNMIQSYDANASLNDGSVEDIQGDYMNALLEKYNKKKFGDRIDKYLKFSSSGGLGIDISDYKNRMYFYDFMKDVAENHVGDFGGEKGFNENYIKNAKTDSNIAKVATRAESDYGATGKPKAEGNNAPSPPPGMPKGFNRQAIVDYANKYLTLQQKYGDKSLYQSGGTSTVEEIDASGGSVGVDCSGLVYQSYLQAGAQGFGRDSDSWYDKAVNANAMQTDYANAQAGDIIFMKGGGDIKGHGGHGHLAIATGDGYMIEASGTNSGIKRSKISDREDLLGFASASLFGAEGTASNNGSTTSDSSRQNADTPDEAYNASIAGMKSKLDEMYKDAGMSESEARKDKIAMGGLVFGTSALNGGTLASARRQFYLTSGVKDSDLGGYGLQGYFRGNGKVEENASVAHLRQKFYEQSHPGEIWQSITLKDLQKQGEKTEATASTKKPEDNKPKTEVTPNKEDAKKNLEQVSKEATENANKEKTEQEQQRENNQTEAEQQTKANAEDKKDVKIDVVVYANVDAEDIMSQAVNMVKDISSLKARLAKAETALQKHRECIDSTAKIVNEQA